MVRNVDEPFLRRCTVLYRNVSVAPSRKYAYTYTFDPLEPHFYIAKNGVYRGIHYFSYFAEKHRLWVLVRTASPTSTHYLCFEQEYKKYQIFFI